MGTIYDKQTIPKSQISKIANLTPSAASVSESKNSNSNSSFNPLGNLSFKAKSELSNSYNLKTGLNFNSIADNPIKNNIDNIASFTSDFISNTATDVNNINSADVGKFLDSSFNLCKNLNHPEKIKNEIGNILKNKAKYLPANLRSGLASLNKTLCGDPTSAIMNGDVGNTVKAMLTLGNTAGLHLLSCNLSIKRVSKLVTENVISTTIKNAEMVNNNVVGEIITKKTNDSELSNAVVGSLNDAINGKGLNVSSVIKATHDYAKKSPPVRKVENSILSTVKTAVKSTFNRKKSNKVLLSDSGDRTTNKNNVEFLASTLGENKYNSSKSAHKNSSSITIGALSNKLTKETIGDENNLDTKPILDTTTKISTLTGVNKNKTFMI